MVKSFKPYDHLNKTKAPKMKSVLSESETIAQQIIVGRQLSLCPYSQLCNESQNGYNLWYPKNKK